MNKPDGITQDVWDAAEQYADELHERDDYMHFESRKVIAKAIQSSVATERARGVATCELWLLQYGNRGDELKHTSPQEWANGAVQDIAEHIRKGA